MESTLTWEHGKWEEWDSLKEDQPHVQEPHKHQLHGSSVHRTAQDSTREQDPDTNPDTLEKHHDPDPDQNWIIESIQDQTLEWSERKVEALLFIHHLSK